MSEVKFDGVPFLPTPAMIEAGEMASTTAFGHPKEEITAIFCSMLTEWDRERRRNAR